MKAVVLIPTYNEAGNIIPLVAEILKQPIDVDVLVIDDNSPDGTARLVEDAAKKFPRLHLFSRTGKRGFASSYLDGFRSVIAKKGAEFLVTMDADFSHHPRYLEHLLLAAEAGDMAIGSRYVTGGGVLNWSFARRILSLGGNFYARLVTGLPIYDLTAGFSAIRLSFLEKIPYQELSLEGYAWLIELKFMMHKNGAKIVEIPIIFEERRSGASKISKSIIAEGLIAPWRLRFRRIGSKNPGRNEASK